MSFIRFCLEEFSFTRLDDLADRVVGKAAGDKRQAIRWPDEIASLKKNVSVDNAVKAVLVAWLITVIISMPVVVLASVLNISLLFKLASGAGLLASTLSFIAIMALDAHDGLDTGQSKKARRIMEPLLGKDPYLDLRAAAYLTVGAMPKWLRTQMTLWRSPGWRRARLAGEPYTVGRAGFDYLDLMLRIERLDKTPNVFYGKSLSPADYRLPGALKESVGEIILFLSSLPETEEDPRDDTVGSVMDTIDHLATIDGESFTAAVRRLHAEEKNGKKNKVESGRDDEIMKAVDAANNAMTVRTDEQYKAVLQGMDRLSKMSRAIELSKTDEHAAEPSAA